MKGKIKLKRINDHTERAILLFLKEKGECSMGDILMHLKLGYQKGYHYLNSLAGKNWVSLNSGPYCKLRVDVE